MSNSNVVKLLDRREEARAKALASPEQARIEDLRDKIVTGSIRGKDVSKLVEERDALKAKAHAEVTALGVQISDARRAEQAEATQAMAAQLESQTTEELEKMRAALSEQRRAGKAKMRAVLAALSKRQSKDRVKTLWESMTPEEQAEMKAHLGVDAGE